ncbi:uncharacterized protein TNCV_656821 [Trichonephila clavipes]|nr:uncharacterized protein TNCV_656821 [Trichonephila clavipes]
MTLADCRRPLLACRMIYRSSPAVVVLGWPPPSILTAVPVVWNAFQARETTLLLIPNSAATLVTVRPSSSFPIILLRVKSSRRNDRTCDWKMRLASVSCKLPVHVNKQTYLPAYIKQLALERIGDIPIDAVQIYTDGSRDNYYRSGRGNYFKSQDHILKIQWRNPDGCKVFHSELIAIDDAVGSFASLPNGKEIWILSDIKSAIQHFCSIRTVAPLVSVFSSWRISGSQFYKTAILAHFRSDHLETMKFSEGCKSFEMCPNCSSEPASPVHILECLGFTKQDLADDPLFVLDFLKVYDVMDLV